jgi:hypothetical protein
MSKGLHGGADHMTFATAMNLDFDGVSREVDLLALHADERTQQAHRPPQLVIGETKSLGRGELITAKGLAKLRSVAAKLPEAVIAIAVLRDHFTVAEKNSRVTSFPLFLRGLGAGAWSEIHRAVSLSSSSRPCTHKTRWRAYRS